MTNRLRNVGIHIGIFLIAQVFFALAAQSWPWEVVTSGTEVSTLLSWNAEGNDVQRWMGSASRIWTIIVIADIVWTALSLGRMRRAEDRADDIRTS